MLDRIGCTSSNTLFAQSICPDEINHEEDDLTHLFHAHLGEVFHMGGLAGILYPLNFQESFFSKLSYHLLIFISPPFEKISCLRECLENITFIVTHDIISVTTNMLVIL
jgi:hypothetical protein